MVIARVISYFYEKSEELNFSCLIKSHRLKTYPLLSIHQFKITVIMTVLNLYQSRFEVQLRIHVAGLNATV